MSNVISVNYNCVCLIIIKLQLNLFYRIYTNGSESNDHDLL